MTKIIQGMWPVYKVDGEIIYATNKDYDAFKTLLGSIDWAKYASNGLSSTNLEDSLAREGGKNLRGPERILAGAAAVAMGRPMRPVCGEAASVMRFLCRSSRPELAGVYFDFCLESDIDNGFVIGLSQEALVSTGFPREAIQTLARGVRGIHWGRKNTKPVVRCVARAALDAWRLRDENSSDTRAVMEKEARLGGFDPTGGKSRWQAFFMWMCSDPWKRLKKFDRPELSRTVEALKRKFPFALPDRFDLDTRSADDIERTLADMFERHEPADFCMALSMDKWRVLSVLSAYDKLMDLRPPSHAELGAGLPERMIGLALYRDDAGGFVKKVLARIPGGSLPKIVFQMHTTLQRTRLREAVAAVYNDGRPLSGVEVVVHSIMDY